MSEKLDQLKSILGEVVGSGARCQCAGLGSKCEHAPCRRGSTRSTTRHAGKIAQEKSTSDEVGRLLNDLKGEFEGGDTDEAALVRVAARNYERPGACRRSLWLNKPL